MRKKFTITKRLIYILLLSFCYVSIFYHAPWDTMPIYTNHTMLPCDNQELMLNTLDNNASLTKSVAATVPIRKTYLGVIISHNLVTNIINIMLWFFFGEPLRIGVTLSYPLESSTSNTCPITYTLSEDANTIS